MKKRSFFRHLKNKYVIIGLVILLIILGYAATHRKSAASFEYATAAVGNVTERVSVTGTVSPINKASLAFKKSGVITAVPVKVGDSVKAGDIVASLDSAADRAALESAQATLADMARNLTPQELSVQKTALDTAKQNALNALHDGYAKAQSAFVNYTDSFFTNPQSVNPSITLRTDSPSIQTNINSERVAVTDAFKQWSNDLGQVTVDSATTYMQNANGYLGQMKSFMGDLLAIVQAINAGNSGMAQTSIDSNMATMNSGYSALNAAIDTVTSAGTALSSAQSAYDLKLAGNSEQSIAAQQAKVSQAQAAVDDDSIFSPIDGVVTQADPNVGEFVAAGQSGFAVQNATGFKVEAYVPEADIAKVAVGDLASSTLDAYGSYVDFPAKVVSIDPAETVLEGVPTYKVTLQFVSADSRIRSGMTDNLEIITHQAFSVLQIPYRAIDMTATSTTVRLVSADGTNYSPVPVTTGLKGSDGTIEITSGLNVGDKVVTYVK
jgi:HlyD family secretion protein